MSASSKSPSVYASSDDEQENLLTKTKVKKSRIIDSDSDNEEDTVKEKSTFKMSDSEKSDTEDLDQRTESFSKKKKIVKRYDNERTRKSIHFSVLFGLVFKLLNVFNNVKIKCLLQSFVG